MPDSDPKEREFGTGIPVIHQGELDSAVRELLQSTLPFEPMTDRFALHAVALRVEERWPDGVLGARITLRTAGWQSLPHLPPELAEDEDIEDAFLGMATRLPANYIEFVTGVVLKYDTNSFQREEHRAYRMDYRVLGQPSAILDAVQELRRANDIRWKKAHLQMLGYLPGGEEHSDARARKLLDQMYGAGTAEQWAAEVSAYDLLLAAYFQQHTVSQIKPRETTPEVQPIQFHFDP